MANNSDLVFEQRDLTTVFHNRPIVSAFGLLLMNNKDQSSQFYALVCFPLFDQVFGGTRLIGRRGYESGTVCVHSVSVLDVLPAEHSVPQVFILLKLVSDL